MRDDNNENDKYNFYKYIDDKSILVITPRNKLMRIRCPFAVMGDNGKIFQVDSVRNSETKIYFMISGKLETHSSYEIIAK